MATVITSDEVVAAFGEYYIDNGQNESNIHNMLMEDFGTQEAFTTIESDDTVLRETNTQFSEVLQGFQKAFTPKGGVVFTPSEIFLRNVKVDQLFYPDDHKQSWLGFLSSNKLDRTEWPFVRWFIEMYVLKQIQEDLELQAIFFGEYVAPTPGVANNANETMDGVRKIINDNIGDMEVIPTGTPSTDPVTWTEQVEAWVESMPEKYWKKGLQLNMNRTLALRYIKGRRTKYNMNYAQVTGLDTVEDFPEVVIKGRASQAGSSKIWGTPKLNAIFGLKGGSNKNIVKVENVDRAVKVYTDFWVGAGFINKSVVFTNDQDT